ncbi:MAG: PRC-barrel domain-containing protein [Desulfobacteraceae bacterium]|nr:PRC-barrel domain-containing protein [Desulfobacteraceae bacterium]
MDMHLNAHVECLDGRIGRLENIILNPKTERMTYLVVRGNDLQNTERLVPERLVKETSHDTVFLSISKKKFEGMKNFIQEEYIPSNITLYMAEQAGWDMGTPASVFVEHEAVPAGGLIVHKGAKVFATDGHAGKVDDFLVEKKTGRITHLILLEGHLWGKKDISVPVNQIDRYEDGNIYLKIDKSGVEALPVIDMKSKGE